MAETDIPEAQALMMRTVEEDFGDFHDPKVHGDIDNMAETYIRPLGPFLVARDDDTGKLLGTAGIRGGELKGDLSPQHLVEKYSSGRTGQLVRVYILKEHRRRGIAKRLVQTVLEQAREERHYDLIALHTFPHAPGALGFWQAMGAELLIDDSRGVSRAMFFEMPAALSS